MTDSEKNKTIETYNKGASALSKKFSNIGPRDEDIKKAFSYFTKKNIKVVEIGCGNGRDAKEIIKFTDNYLGMDISEEMVKIARQNVPVAKFEIADVEVFSFPENTDIIFSFVSLLHSNKEKLKDVFERAYEALNTRGIFYISLKYGDYHKETKTDEFGTRTYYFYTPDIISELANGLFQIIYKDFQDLRGQKRFTIVLQKTA